MIKVLPESKGNILVLRTAGKLTDQDYKDVLIPRLNLIIREHGKARLLLDMGDDFHGLEAAALWDDARFGVAHRNDFEKVGVIGAPRWVEWGMKLADIVVSGELEDALGKAASTDGLVFIEIHTERLDCPEALRKAGRAMAKANQLD